MTEAGVKAELLNATRRLVLENGIERLSLRTVTAAIGKTTSAVFQHFGGRDALLTALCEQALAEDATYHRDTARTLSGLAIDRDTLTDIVHHHVIQRTTLPPALIALEASMRARAPSRHSRRAAVAVSSSTRTRRRPS